MTKKVYNFVGVCIKKVLRNQLGKLSNFHQVIRIH